MLEALQSKTIFEDTNLEDLDRRSARQTLLKYDVSE